MNRDKQPVSACNMSVAQQEYVAREIRRHRQVTICRVMLLVLLLALWELAADMHWIDSFIFSRMHHLRPGMRPASVVQQKCGPGAGALSCPVKQPPKIRPGPPFDCVAGQ